MQQARRMSRAGLARRFALGLYKGTPQVRHRAKWLATNTFYNRTMIASEVKAKPQSVMTWEAQDKFKIRGRGARPSFSKWINPKKEQGLLDMLEEPEMTQMTIASHYGIELAELRSFCRWRKIDQRLRILPIRPPQVKQPPQICPHCDESEVKVRNVCWHCFEIARRAGYVGSGPRCVECGRHGYGKTARCLAHFVRYRYRLNSKAKPHKKRRPVVFNRPCPVCRLPRTKCSLKKLVKNR